jgi:hypothetical protein
MIDDTKGYVSIRWVGVCLIALSEIGFHLDNAFTQEESKRPPSAGSTDGPPIEWGEVPSSEKSSVLDIIAGQTQANYEKIRTWKGTYRVRLRQHVPAGAAQEQFRMAGVADKAPALWQEFDFGVRFAIDMVSGPIFRSKETKKMRWIRDGSNETITLPNTSPVDERSIVTAEHYLHFDPKVVWPGFAVVRGRPEARNKHAAFRESPEVAESQNLGNLFDPRAFFGLAPHRTLGKELGELSRALKGGLGNDLKKKCDDVLAIHRAASPAGTWYRMTETMDRRTPGSSSYMYMTVIFSPAAGLNPVSLTMAEDKAAKQPVRIVRWVWKTCNGVHVPQEVRESLYSEGSGTLYYERELTLEEPVVNGPLDPSQFTYQGLGMKDGDLVMDHINKACYILENGSPKLLANYDEKQIPQLPGVGSFVPRWGLVIVGLLVLVFLVLVCRRIAVRRAKT